MTDTLAVFRFHEWPEHHYNWIVRLMIIFTGGEHLFVDRKLPGVVIPEGALQFAGEPE